MFLIWNDFDFLHECACFKNVFNHLCMEFWEILLEQNEDYLDCTKCQEKSNNKRILKKLME